MKKFSLLPGTNSNVVLDVENPERYYSLSSDEWNRALAKHVELGHPEPRNDRYFAGLPDDFLVKVRPYRLSDDDIEYFEQDQFIDLPANRLVSVPVRG